MPHGKMLGNKPEDIALLTKWKLYDIRQGEAR